MANRDTYKYELRNGNKVVYVGITNDLGRREAEHRNEGMKFTSTTKILESDLFTSSYIRSAAATALFFLLPLINSLVFLHQLKKFIELANPL